ncbi:hypothetical protein GP486_000942 [Trichoglossum hirsutum]|uniref:Uncharacterized protein n=1 Tax=Trichoglossum hirsutum TaxID=265104 RepID=A0A9P8RTK6_9PEZI|nr:hypothetical protein GP486_000942 [Trichoglossum hirsutum]
MKGPAQFLLPGFTLPLNFCPGKERTTHDPAEDGTGELWPNALNGSQCYEGEVALPLTTLREFTMLRLMDHLTDKPHWDTKIFDDDIANKWKSEALASPGQDITQNMVDWVIAELRYRSEIFQKTGAVKVYNGDVVKSDIAVPGHLKEALKAAVISLEDIPDMYKDYHPGSDGKVLDLVHPSLFPLVYGRSRILPDSLSNLSNCIESCGEGEIIPIPPEEEAELGRSVYFRRNETTPYSRKFQWLPCELEFTGDDGNVSYINNLHPQKHKGLYTIIEQVIARAIPLWNMTLRQLKTLEVDFKRIKYLECEYDPDDEDIPDDQRPQREPGEEYHDYCDRHSQWCDDIRKVVQPQPGVFQPPEPRTRMSEGPAKKNSEESKLSDLVDLEGDFGRRGLQVIVKLANIHLTPEKPEYEGGTWHVEGQLNEHICATALYYYDSVNITESRLAFRQQSDTSEVDDISYRQDHSDWLEEVFGCERDGPGVQDVGEIICKEGRLITFPNILQHRVNPFRLEDTSQPGHRKILAIFLVDPHIRIISTANVPPQRRDWWAERIISSGVFSRMAGELQDIIFSNIDDFPIGMDEAKELRLELMEERKKYAVTQNGSFVATEFSLCEH